MGLAWRGIVVAVRWFATTRVGLITTGAITGMVLPRTDTGSESATSPSGKPDEPAPFVEQLTALFRSLGRLVVALLLFMIAWITLAGVWGSRTKRNAA